MRKRYAFFILTVLIFTGAQAQVFSPAVDFAFPLGDNSNFDNKVVKVIGDNQGNYYVLAQMFDNSFDADPTVNVSNYSATPISGSLFLAKYNSVNLPQWVVMVSPNNSILPTDIILDTGGDVYVSGTFSGSNVDFDPGPGTTAITSQGFDGFIAKYNDVLGTLTWVDKIGGSGTDIVYDMVLNGSNQIVATGSFEGTANFNPAGSALLTSAGGSDAFFAIYNNGGVYISAFDIGSTGNDYGKEAGIDGSGNIFVGGNFEGTIDLDPGVGGVYITGAGQQDMFVGKYNSAGAYQQGIILGGASDDELTSLKISFTASFVIAGTYQGTADFDPTGSVLSYTAVGSDDAFYGSYYLTNMNPVFVKSIGGSGTDRINEITHDGSGSYYVCGSYTGNDMDTDPQAGTQYLPNASNSGSFLCKYDMGGNYGWKWGYTAHTLCDMANTVWATTNNTFQVYTGGQLGGAIDFNPMPGVLTVNPGSSPGSIAGYVARYFTCTNSEDPQPGSIQASNTQLCSPSEQVTLTLTTGVLGSGANWTWYNGIPGQVGSTVIGNGSPITLTPGTSGYYYVQAEGGCSPNSNWDVIEITVNDPEPVLTGDDTVCTGDQVTLYAGSVSGSLSYQWLHNNSIQNMEVVTVTSDTTFALVGSINGCSDTAYFSITALNCNTTGWEENTGTIIQVYPNPTAENVYIQTGSNSTGEIQIFSMEGKLLLTQSHPGGTSTISLNSLSSGTYIIKLRMNEEVITRKFIKTGL